MSRDVVFLVWHTTDPDDDDTAKLLGVFSSRSNADERVARAKSQPGFSDYPDCFEVAEYALDVDKWTTGFVLIDPETWEAEGFGGQP